MKEGKYSNFLAATASNRMMHNGLHQLKELVASLTHTKIQKNEEQLELEYHLKRKAELMLKFKKRFPNGAVIDTEAVNEH